MTSLGRTSLRTGLVVVLMVFPLILGAAPRRSGPAVLFTPAGRLATRNYIHLSYALAAFSSQAAFDYSLDKIRPQIAALLCAPDLDGVDLNAPLTLHYLRPQTVGSASNTLHRVAVVRLRDNGTLLFNALQVIYASYEQHPWGVTFSHPHTGYSWPHPQITVNLTAQQAILSTSPTAIEWFEKFGSALQTHAYADSTLAGDFEPAALAEMLDRIAPRQQIDAGSTTILHLFTRMFATSLPYLGKTDFTANADGLAASVTASVLPQTSTSPSLTIPNKRSAALTLAAAAVIPEEAIYASIEACPSSFGNWLSNVFDGEATGLPSLRRLVDVPASAHIAYLTPSRNSQALVYASILATDDPAAHLCLATQMLAKTRLGTELVYRRQPARDIGTRTVQSYRLAHVPKTKPDESKPPSATISADTLPLLLALFSDGLTCELAATDRYLVLTLGPSNTLSNILVALDAAQPSAAHFQERWRVANFVIPAKAESVSVLYPVRLFHTLVRILPGSRAEMIRRIPTIGDGIIAVRMPPGKDGRSTAILRIAANELKSLQIALERGRPIIQELLLLSAFQSLMTRQPVLEKENTPGVVPPLIKPMPTP